MIFGDGGNIARASGAVSVVTTQLGFPAMLTSVWSSTTGYSWKRRVLESLALSDPSLQLTGDSAVPIDDNKGYQIGQRGWMEPAAGGVGWLFFPAVAFAGEGASATETTADTLNSDPATQATQYAVPASETTSSSPYQQFVVANDVGSSTAGVIQYVAPAGSGTTPAVTTTTTPTQQTVSYTLDGETGGYTVTRSGTDILFTYGAGTAVNFASATVTGLGYQPLDNQLTAIAALSPTGVPSVYEVPGFTGTGPTDCSLLTVSTFTQGLIGQTSAALWRTGLGLEIGTNVQAYDADLAALAGLTSAADKLPYFTGSGTAAVTDYTAEARTLDALTDPGADRILFWDDSAGAYAYLTAGSGLAIVGTTITASGSGVSDADYGDVTVSGGGTVWTIDNDAVTYAKIQNVSTTDKVLGRSTAGAGDVEEIACTAAGRALIDDADASAQRTTLGLGTAAVANTGTSGATVPLLDGANTFSAAQIVRLNDAETAIASTVFQIGHNSTGTPAADFGLRFLRTLETTTTVDQTAFSETVVWVDATHATRRAAVAFFVNDAAGTRPFIRGEASGSAAMIGFLGASASARLVSPDAGTALVTFGLASGTPTFAGANITGVVPNATAAATVATSNEATDTTCFPLFVTASGTQTLEPKNNTAFTFNSNTAALGVTTIELGHASDTTLVRSSAGNISIEGNVVYRVGGIDVGLADGGTNANLSATGPGVLRQTAVGGNVGVGQALDYILLRDEKAANTEGGTSSSTTTHTRTLNTEVVDTGGNCSLASNQFTLSAGTYRIHAIVPAYRTGRTQAYLYNATDAAAVADCESNSAYFENANNVNGFLHIKGRFTVAASKALEIRHYITTGVATQGLGLYGGAGLTEIYTQVELWKEVG